MNGTVEGPTPEELRAKVERAARKGGKGRPDIGAMSRAERDEALFGTVEGLVERLRQEASDQESDYDAVMSPDTAREAADRIEQLEAQRVASREALVTDAMREAGKAAWIRCIGEINGMTQRGETIETIDAFGEVYRAMTSAALTIGSE